ncbi:hypothetical protein VNI00_001826 [Paramarasmius palmivorus]|uniref:Uncharacterized protein n=1 Tax=Paramarasmius palmivorus TaxID=297713 RepID=A0AAW0E4S5_9AGAR
MSSYVKPTQRRKRGFTESATAYKRKFPEALSPEYATAARPQYHSGEYTYGKASAAVDEDIKHALYAQERAKARRAVLDASPRRAICASPAKSASSRSEVRTPVQPMNYDCRVPESPAYPSTAALDHYNFPPRSSAQDARAREMYHDQRFGHVRDSLTLPYHQSRNQAKSKLKPPTLTIQPPSPSSSLRRQVVVDQAGSVSSEFGWVIGSPPPRKAEPIKMYRESPKQLAPLQPFDPYLRPRADSLSAVLEDREVYDAPYAADELTPTTPNTRMRRMKSVNDIFSSINEKAQRLGLKTTIC